MSEEPIEGYGLEPPAPPPSQPDGRSTYRAGSAAPPVDLKKTDVICLNCGYNLRGLEPTGRCPECGTPVFRSINGNLLIFSAPEYLASLQRGLLFILIAVIAGIVLAVVTVIAMVAAGGQSSFLVDLGEIGAVGIAGLSLLGWWLFSEPDPAILGNEQGNKPRRVIRAAVIVSAACSVLSLACMYAMRRTQSAEIGAGLAGMIDGIASLVVFFASMMYIQWLAPRIPDRNLHAQASKYMWMLPVIYVLGTCVIVGPLIATILYYVMLNNIRTQLQSIRQRQAREFSAME